MKLYIPLITLVLLSSTSLVEAGKTKVEDLTQEILDKRLAKVKAQKNANSGNTSNVKALVKLEKNIIEQKNVLKQVKDKKGQTQSNILLGKLNSDYKKIRDELLASDILKKVKTNSPAGGLSVGDDISNNSPMPAALLTSSPPPARLQGSSIRESEISAKIQELEGIDFSGRTLSEDDQLKLLKSILTHVKFRDQAENIIRENLASSKANIRDMAERSQQLSVREIDLLLTRYRAGLMFSEPAASPVASLVVSSGAQSSEDDVLENQRVDLRTATSVDPVVQGLSVPEGWGTWSTAKEVVLTFGKVLPEDFKVTFTALAYGPNAGKDFEMKVGSQTQIFQLTPGFQTVSLNFKNVLNQKRMTIVVPEPTIPAGGDRELGIGLVEFNIEKLDL